MVERLYRLSEQAGKISWGALVLALPVTSFPLVAKLLGAAMVSAASGIFLFLMVVLWFVPYILRGGKISSLSRPLLGFGMAALISAAAAFFIEIPPLKEVPFWRKELEALFTLGVGVGFYLVTVTWVRSEEKLRHTLQLINVGGAVMIAYALLQAFFWFTQNHFPPWMVQFQKFFVLHKLYAGRVSGFAYEPSWLAHVLNMIYLPYWTAAALLGTSAFRWRFRWLTVERVLLGGGWLAMFWSFSRVGMAAYLLMLTPLLIYGNVRLIRWLQGGIFRALKINQKYEKAIRRIISVGMVIAFLLVYFAAAIGMVYLASRFDFRLARLFDFESLKKENFLQLANYLVFAERVIYWDTAYRIFGDFPILGVGLGNSGFFFPEKMTAFAWALPEVHQILFWAKYLPNPKSLWMRLLAETGLLGFSLFVAWLFLLWQAGKMLLKGSSGMLKTVGLMGSLVLVGLFAEGFSVDTFALPYFWISFGLLTSAAGIAVLQKRILEPDGRGEGLS